MSDVPRRTAQRTAKLVSLPLGMAGRGAIGLGKRVGGQSAEAVAAQFQAKTAEQVFAVLGELKGGAMKIGQALSVMEAAMPEEWAGPYRATLTKLQEAAPPLPPAQVHAVLAAELGRGRTAAADGVLTGTERIGTGIEQAAHWTAAGLDEAIECQSA